MANNIKFTELLNNYLAGKATPEDYRQLMQLIKGGKFDDLLKSHIDHALHHADTTTDLDENNSRQILLNILNSEQQTDELINADKPAIKRRILLWTAAAAAVLLFVTVFYRFPDKKINKKEVARIENKKLQPIIGDKGKKYIRLEDGSTVLLNKGSRLDYPETFGTATREVTLTGEGYFDIQHEAARPFIVHTGKVKTTVLGTAFNIRAYPGQKEIIVTVTRGKVKVSDDKKTMGTITSNESIAVNTENKSYRQEKVSTEEAVAWKKQYLVLDNISLGDAAVLIDARYHVTISFSKDELKDCRISATFLDNESLEHVLNVVTGVINGRYSSQPNDQVIISGKGCN
jgi:transmembrane sensor